LIGLKTVHEEEKDEENYELVQKEVEEEVKEFA
jgi:hypothetical protein